MSEVIWTRRHDKFTKYADVNNQTKKSIIICPPEIKIYTAVRLYSLTSGYYILTMADISIQLSITKTICMSKIMIMIHVNQFVSKC